MRKLSMYSFEKYAFFLFLGFVALTGILGYGNFISEQGPPTWDGAEHSYHGLSVYSALEHSSGVELKQATMRQTLWPFLHSWMLAAVFYITGPSFVSARLLSLLLWLLISLLTFGIARNLAQNDRKNITGFLAGALVLSSPM